jgi:hypothetical protein
MQNYLLNATITLKKIEYDDASNELPNPFELKNCKAYLEKKIKVFEGTNGSMISTSYFLSIPERNIPVDKKITKSWKILLEGETDPWLIISVEYPSGRFLRNIEVYI